MQQKRTLRGAIDGPASRCPEERDAGQRSPGVGDSEHRQGAGGMGRGKGGRARTPAHGQGLRIAALVHQLVAVLGQGLQLGLVTGHPQEPGQLLHHPHEVLEGKSREWEPGRDRRPRPGRPAQSRTRLGVKPSGWETPEGLGSEADLQASPGPLGDPDAGTV